MINKKFKTTFTILPRQIQKLCAQESSVVLQTEKKNMFSATNLCFKDNNWEILGHSREECYQIIGIS